MSEEKKIGDIQTRKWQITINNPDVKGYTHEKIIDLCNSMKSLLYMCMSDEVGECGTFHTHIYLHFSSAVRFSTIDKKFHGGHFDVCKGTAIENRDYIFKIGKHANTEKNTTNIADSHYEIGEIPIERQGKRNDLDDLYDMIAGGMSDFEIITECPSYIGRVDKIDKVRQTIMREKHKNVWRKIQCVYVWGDTGVGKTRGIMEEYGYENVYRVTNYQHPFDGYAGEDIVLFDEFRSCLQLKDMLKYLDGYPLMLPCRYHDKVALFTKVFICSNIPLSMQYPNAQREERESYKALMRRIQEVRRYKNGIVSIGTPDNADFEEIEEKNTPFAI